ncbi:MAG: galactose-1-epimerase, partial [Anaerotignaceae bacterium]
AKTTQDTPINITNHTYFNLNGHEDGSILDNKLTLFSEEITQINENILPNGEFLKVKGTAFDYTEEKEIGRDVESNEPQIQFANGYDHNYVFAKERENPLKLVAKARSEKTNITMELSITQPGLQFYSGNFLDGDVGKDGAIYGKRSGFCLEPQGFADALNIKSFPNSVLKSNEAYIQKIVYKIINQ